MGIDSNNGGERGDKLYLNRKKKKLKTGKNLRRLEKKAAPIVSLIKGNSVYPLYNIFFFVKGLWITFWQRNGCLFQTKWSVHFQFDYKMTWKPYNHPNDFSWITLPYFAIVRKLIKIVWCWILTFRNRKLCSAFIFVSSEVAVLSQFSPKISVRMPLIGEMGWDDFINICWDFTELHFSSTAVWLNHIQDGFKHYCGI